MDAFGSFSGPGSPWWSQQIERFLTCPEARLGRRGRIIVRIGTISTVCWWARNAVGKDKGRKPGERKICWVLGGAFPAV